MPETATDRPKRSLSMLLSSLFSGRSKNDQLPEALDKRMSRIERDMYRRLPSKGFLK